MKQLLLCVHVCIRLLNAIVCNVVEPNKLLSTNLRYVFLILLKILLLHFQNLPSLAVQRIFLYQLLNLYYYYYYKYKIFFIIMYYLKKKKSVTNCLIRMI